MIQMSDIINLQNWRESDGAVWGGFPEGFAPNEMKEEKVHG